MSKKAILVGATGLIGADLLNKLLASNYYSEVLVITRREIKNENIKFNQLIIDFEDIHKYETEIIGDDVFCCLGSTAKKTPDLKVYKKIDYQYPLDVAKIALKNGAKTYSLISAMGANVNSSLFYTRTKGEVERDLQLIPFLNINIYRPGLLDGKRKEDRKIENLFIGFMRIINPILIGPLKKYRSIKAETVAAAMLNQANKKLKGAFIYPSNKMEILGK